MGLVVNFIHFHETSIAVKHNLRQTPSSTAALFSRMR